MPIYIKIGGKLQVVADTNTAIPSGVGNFTGFQTPSLSNGSVAFTGFGSSGLSGIYTNAGGSLVTVVASGDLLDGKIVKGISFCEQGFSQKKIPVAVSFEQASNLNDALYSCIVQAKAMGLPRNKGHPKCA